MALNNNALKEMVGLAAQRGELVLHTAQGMLIAEPALMKDDAVIYIAGMNQAFLAGPTTTPEREQSPRCPSTSLYSRGVLQNEQAIHRNRRSRQPSGS